jgi:hypothetical protein
MRLFESDFGADCKSYQCYVAVVVLRFVSHLTLSVNKEEFLKFELVSVLKMLCY